MSSKEKHDEESIIDKKIVDVVKRIEKVEKDVNKNGATLDTINKMLHKLLKRIEKYNKSNAMKTTRLRTDVLDRTDQLENRLGETVELLNSLFKELDSKDEDIRNQISLIKEWVPKGFDKLKTDFFARLDDVKNKTDIRLTNMTSMIEHLSTSFKEHIAGYATDKTEFNKQLVTHGKQLVALDTQIATEVTTLHNNISERFKSTEGSVLTRLDDVKNKTDIRLTNMTSMIEHLSTSFKEHIAGYATDKTEFNKQLVTHGKQLVALDTQIATEVTTLHNNISERFKSTEENIIENLKQIIDKTAESQEKTIENVQSMNQNIREMRETYRAEFSTQLDEFEKTYTILSELVSDFNQARESQAESGKKVSEIYDTIHWKFETLRDELSSRFEVLEGRVTDTLDQLIENFNTMSRESEESLRALNRTIDSLKIAYVDRLTKNLESLSLDIESTKNAIISAIPMQSMALDSNTLVGVKKTLESSSKDLGDKLRTLKEEQVSLVNIQANLVSTLREYRTMLQELRITLLDKMDEFEKLVIR